VFASPPWIRCLPAKAVRSTDHHYCRRIALLISTDVALYVCQGLGFHLGAGSNLTKLCAGPYTCTITIYCAQIACGG
jgi:hypothetical protein